MKRFWLALPLVISIAFFAGGQSPAKDDESGARFAAIDIRIDPHGQRLAAYQFELVDDAGAATIAGVEGGERAAFAEPPYYDAKALAGGRIIIAAFNTGHDLPTSDTRVARIHVRLAGNQQPKFRVELQAAADVDANPVNASITMTESN